MTARVPGRAVWNLDAIDGGSRTMVNLATGEINAILLAQRSANATPAIASQASLNRSTVASNAAACSVVGASFTGNVNFTRQTYRGIVQCAAAVRRSSPA